jgi:error-prone DNA polymerase
LQDFHEKIVAGMLKNGYTREFAEQCFLQIRGFGEYGFPESHAASFALLVYVSAWIKRYYPAEFCAALLNSQPMGFYAPAQIVRDARNHGVEVRAVDVNFSQWDCALECRVGLAPPNPPRREASLSSAQPAVDTTRHRSCVINAPHGGASPTLLSPESKTPSVRLGFRQIKGFQSAHAERIVAARRQHGLFDSIPQFQRATALPRHILQRLAEADAFASLGLSRRQALWQVLALSDDDAPLFDSFPSCLRASVPSCPPPMPLAQEVLIDYRTTTLSLKRHPVSLVRDKLDVMRILPADQIRNTDHGTWVRVAGLVLIRQRPGTASGIVFITLEDETGIVNLIVRPNIYDKYRPAARGATLLHAEGRLERQGEVIHVLVYRLYDQSHLLAGHQVASRDFH